MQVNERQSFKAMPLYDLTARVQENTLLNRGLIEIGGCGAPHAIMANNKFERTERISEMLLYFGMSFLTPFILLPLFNRKFLSSNGLVKNFKNNEKRLLEVSKDYLSKDADHMIKGIKEKAKSIAENAEKSKNSKTKTDAKSIEKDFENVLNRFSNKEELRTKLLKAHERVFMSDFLSTALMWCAAPWIVTEMTEHRTHRKGFSAAFNMVEDKKIDEKEYNKDKYKRMILSALIAVVPAIVAPKLVTKAIKGNHKPLIESKNILKKGVGKFLDTIKKNASNFDYTNAMFMSKTIFASMWLLCSYPSCLVSARDKYEVKDRAIRKGALLTMYFGGDFIVNNITGRIADKHLGTKIMDTDKIKKDAGFFERFKLSPRSFYELPNMKGVDQKTLQKTKSVGASLYWVSLISNMALIGFALPAVLNKLLKKSVEKVQVDTLPSPAAQNLSKAFEQFKM